MSVKNLGQVSAIHIGTSAPTNKNLIWRDLSVSPNLWKIWNSQTSLWETVPSEIAQSITANLVFDNVAAIQNILGYKNNDTVIDKSTDIVYRFSSISVATPVTNLIIKPTNIVSGAGRWIKSFSIIEEAPIDGVKYVRQDGGWVTLDADDIDDTSTDNKFLTSTEKTDLLQHIDEEDEEKHFAGQISATTSSFTKNLTPTDDTTQKIADRLDKMPFGLEWQYNSAAFVSDLTAGQFQFNADKTILYLSYVLNPNVGLSNTIQNYVEGIKSGSKFIFRDSTGKILEAITTSDSAQVGASIFAQMGCTVLNDSGIGNGLNCVVEIAGVGGGAGLTPEEAADLTDSKIENIFFTALAPDYGVVTRPYNFKVTAKVDTGGITTIKTSANVAYTLNNTVLAGGYLKVTADTLLMRTHLTIERVME